MNTDTMIQAEHQADRVRGELWRTLEELDRRRVEAMDWRAQLKANWKLLAAAGGVLAAMIGAKAYVSYRARTHVPKPELKERWGGLRRMWEHPERVAPIRHARSAELGNKLLTIVGTAVATQLAKKVAVRVID